MDLNQIGNSQRANGQQTEMRANKHARVETHRPKLLCAGETGLGDRLGELVSMLWVIW